MKRIVIACAVLALAAFGSIGTQRYIGSIRTPKSAGGGAAAGDLTLRISPETAYATSVYDRMKDLTYAGTTLTPLFYYQASDATGTVWADATGVGEELDITGPGADPTLSQVTPIYNQTGVMFNDSDFYEADTSATGNLADGLDFMLEAVVYVEDIAATQRVIIGKYDGGSNHYFLYQNTASIVFQIGGVGPIRCLNAVAVNQSWYYITVFGDRSGNAMCLVDGIAESPVAISAAASASNQNTLTIGSLNNTPTQPSDHTIEHIAMWTCADGCLAASNTDANSNSIADWTEIARERMMKLVGIWPTIGGSTMVATALTRSSHAYIPTQPTDGGAKRLFYVGAGWPRVEESFATTHTYGVMVEPDVTNIFTYSEVIDNAAWTKSSATITANDATVTAPDGTTSSDKLAATGNGAYFKMVVDHSTTSVSYTVSGFFRPITYNWVRFATDHTTLGRYPGCYVNISDGSIGTVAPDAVCKAEPYGNGWYRVSMTYYNDAADATFGMYFYCAEGDEDVTYSAADCFHVWGMQDEISEHATSYIFTSTAAATRQYDHIQLTSSADIVGLAGTVYTEMVYANGALVDGVAAGDDRWLYQITNSGSDPYITAQLNASESITSTGYATDAQWSIAGTTGINTGTITTNRLKYAADAVEFLIGESSEGTDSSSTFATGANIINIGSVGSAGDQLSGSIFEVQVYSTSTDEVN